MTYGYSQLAPQLVKFGDGQMLIWEDDKSDRTQLNSTNLMYSIYTPATETTPGFWSVAKSVYDDGTADGRFNVLSANNTVYIVFENHKNTFADRQTISLKDYTSATEICLATYDAMKGGFAIKSLSAGEGNANSSTVDYKPMITANDFDANIAFTWLRNSNSDISGTSGTTSIIKSTITSTDSTPVYSSVYTTGTGVPIQDYTIGYSGSSNILQIAYKSGNVIYLKKGSQSPEVVVEGGTGTVGHLTMTNLNNRLALMWWNSNGNIYYVPDTYLLENIIPIFSKQSSATIDANGNSIATAVPYPATINYQVIKGDNGKAALVYLSGNGYDDPNDGTDIYKQKTDLFSVAYNSTTRSWDDYQANISNINEEIGTISGFIDNEGFYNIAETMVIPIYESITGDNGYQTERYKDSAAQLKILKVKPAAKLEVEDGTLYYSPDELEVAKEFLAASPSDPQTLNTYVNVRNTGERQIKGVRLTMYETVGDTVTVATYVYYPYVEINPGDEYQPLEIAYNVPQNLTERTLKVLVTPLNELYESVVDETYRVGIAVIGGIDLSLDISTRLDKNLYSVSGMALNKSDRAVSGVNVDVYLLDPATMGPTGNPIETFSFTTIDAKAGKPFQFTWDIGDTSKVYFGSNQSNSYVIVVSSTDGGTDIKPYNNDETFGIQNPYKSFLPFNVSVSDFAQTESKISFDLIASNNLPVENSGDVKVTILDSDNDELGVRTIEINNIKGEESRLTTVEFTGASVLQDAYMVVARFISSANGTDFIDDGGTASVSDDVYYFSNVQITPLAAFTYSSDNSVSSFILEPVGTAVATMDRSFSDSVLEYRLNPFTPGKFRVAVESGDLNATMAYQIDNGRMKYILSGEKSEEFELGQGEVLSLIVTAQNQEKKEFKFITPPRLDADLTGITFTSGILSPAFNKDVLEYNLNSARSSNIKFTPTASDTRAAKIEYQIGETDSPHIINSGTQTEYVNLNAGDIINIKVTAQDETTIKEYRIKFTGVVYDSPVSSSSPSVTPTPPPDSGNGKLPVINAMLVNFDDIKDKKSNGIDILVNNKKVELATETSGLYGDQQISFVQINDEGVINRISAEKDGSTITINAEGDKNITVISLNAQTVKEMENRKDILSVQSGNITFTIPAQEFSIDNVSKIIGESVRKEDIKVNVVISSPAVNVQNYIKTVSSKNNYSLIIPPVQFDIICQYGDKKVEVAKFNSYVERIIEIPSDVDPFSITTAVVLGQDGSMTPVPTKIVENGGKYYASFSSMSNSVYTLIGYQKEFRDIFGHWSERNIHELALKLIVNGYSGNTFAPENDMTRAEFATITVNALGLMRKGTGKTVFDDVAKKSWYFDAVSIAYENGIVSGTTSDTFSPNDKITREQAMTMISRAMKLTGLFKELDAGSEVAILSNFTDSHQLSDWATGGVAQCIRAKIVNGVSDLEIAPMENITRAEVAAIISRLLKKSGLIN